MFDKMGVSSTDIDLVPGLWLRVELEGGGVNVRDLLPLGGTLIHIS